MKELGVRFADIGFRRARDVVVVVCIELQQVVPTEVMASPLSKRKTPTELRVWSLFLVSMFHCMNETPTRGCRLCSFVSSNYLYCRS